MSFLSRSNAILGINARNLLYIRPFNKKRAIQLADSKLKTKLLLASRDLPVPRLLASIRSLSELDAFDWSSLQHSFVLKPNRGYGGEGILVTKLLRGGVIATVSGRPIERAQLDQHVRSILDGRHSLSNLPDIALIEEKIIPPAFLRALSPVGLPDIRVIVFNLVPVIAMLRLPTAESGGKANLHQGGVAVGLDLATGSGTYAYYRGRYVETIPGTDVPVRSVTIPGWDRILLTAARAQRISNVGYLAVDIALNKREKPLVLEMNARGGLTIQLACRVPLRTRLERVAGLHVTTAERGVQIAQEFFGEQIERAVERVSGREVLGRVEPVTLRLAKGRRVTLLAQIDPGFVSSSIDADTALALGLQAVETEDDAPKRAKARLRLGTKDLRTELRLRPLSASRYKVIIGTRDLLGFLIDPLKKVTIPEQSAAPATSVAPMALAVDQLGVDARLGVISRELSLLAQLRPLNLETERERFLVDPGANPRFVYPPADADLPELREEIARMACGPGPLGEILALKRDELGRRATLLAAVGSEGFTDASLALFPIGDAEDEAAARAVSIVPPPEHTPEFEQRLLSADALLDEVGEYLRRLGLDWEVRVVRDQASDFMVSKGNVLSIRRGVRATRTRLRGTIAHELETHAFTTENGAQQPYKIFRYGFGDFLYTQDGLADTIKKLTIGEEAESRTQWDVLKYLAVLDARTQSFAELAASARAQGVQLRQSFNVALRAKRGIGDTSKPGAFSKDVVYWVGRRRLEAWTATGGDLRELFVGKVNLDQLDLVRQLPGLQAPKLLPEILRTP